MEQVGLMEGVSNSLVPNLYRDSMLGINLHNSLGPINGRLYDCLLLGFAKYAIIKNILTMSLMKVKK